MRLILATVLTLLTVPVLAAPPNIVLILTDDLGVNDLGCYGRTEHRTPNLDRLAREGVRFTSAYAAASICSPTRAALMTGRSPAELHLTTFLPGRPDAPSQRLLHPKIAANLNKDPQALAKQLRNAGYMTGCFGKWHLGGKGHQPTDYGFDLYYAGKANTPPSATEGGKGEFDLTQRAIDFIDQAKAKPFFVYLAHNSPHIPYMASPQRIAANNTAFEPTYAAVIESLDESVGLLLKTLKEQNLEQNTLVIFTSDNGGLHVPELKHSRITYNKPYRAGKGFLYEGGIRVPLLARWPGQFPAGQSIATPVITNDVYQTILAASGKATTAPGLRKLMAEKPDRPLYWHQPHYTNQGGRPASAIRHGQWKLIHHLEDDSRELFNLETDPAEQTNLAEKHLAEATRLHKSLTDWLIQQKAQQMRPNPKFNAAAHRRLYVEFDPSRYDPTDPKQEAKAQAWRQEMDAATKAKE